MRQFRRAHILPAQPLDAGNGKVVDFSDRKLLRFVFENMRNFVRAAYADATNGAHGSSVAPKGVPVLIEHKSVGGNFGVVVDLELDDGESADAGIWAVHTFVEPTDGAVYSMVSPRYWWGFVDNVGGFVPLALLEMSYVSEPHILIGQQPAQFVGDIDSAITSMALDSTYGSATISATLHGREGFATCHSFPLAQQRGNTMTPEIMQAITDAITAAINPLADRVAAIEAKEATEVHPPAAAATAPAAAPAVTQAGITAMSRALGANPKLAPAVELMSQAYSVSEEYGASVVRVLETIAGAAVTTHAQPAAPVIAPTPNGQPITAFGRQVVAPTPQKRERTSAEIDTEALKIQKAAHARGEKMTWVQARAAAATAA